MKNLVLTTVFSLITVLTFAQKTTKEVYSSNGLSFEISCSLFEMGKVKQNKPQDAVFELVNKGGKPVIIKDVKGSCSCTTPHWDKKPVGPNQKTKIRGTFNAKEKGNFLKHVIVTIEGYKEPIKLFYKGVVEP